MAQVQVGASGESGVSIQPQLSEDLAQRSLVSAVWSSGTSLITVVLLFARSVLLARLLPVEVFGIYSGAVALVGPAMAAAAFGTGGAFLHRAAETEDVEVAASVHLTLQSVVSLVTLVVLISGSVLFVRDPRTRTALVLLSLTGSALRFAQTGQLILRRNVVHRRLALLELLGALASTIVAVGLAVGGVKLWSLLSVHVVVAATTLIGLYGWRPAWRPRFAWVPSIVRYYFRFGSRVMLASVLALALDRLDDLWTRFRLGPIPMGYYSRAYSMATYPRTVIALPVNQVAGGTYAELKGDRERLSKAFFRVNAFLVRSGFLVAGVLAVVAPEFVRVVLGEKWLPMLGSFRLMLVFTLLDPIRVTISSLFVALGRPGDVVRSRLIQLLVMVPGVAALGTWRGIEGVALATNGVLLVGIVILLVQAKPHVDFSVRRLFLVPCAGLGLGLLASYLLSRLTWIAARRLAASAGRGLACALVYVAVLAVCEGGSIKAMLGPFCRALACRKR